MNRRILATVLTAAALAPAGASAASRQTQHTRPVVWSLAQQQSLAHLARAAVTSGSFRGTTLGGVVTPERAPAANTSEDVSLYRVPDAAFSPATVNPRYDGTEDNAHADTGNFALFHSSSYSSMGRASGYLERADWTPSGASGPVTFYYQESTFGGTAAASAAYQNGVDHLKSAANETPTDCTADLKTPCSLFGYTVTDLSGSVSDGVYGTLQFNQCLVEVDASAADSVFKAQMDQIAKTSAAVMAAGLAIAQTTCTGASAPGPQPTPVPSKNTVSYRAPTNLLPSGVQVSKDYVPTNTDDFFKLFHPTTTMAQLGRLADEGYVEGVVWSGKAKQKTRCGNKKCTKKVSFAVTMVYVASVFPSSGQAAAAFNDGKQQFTDMQDASSLLPSKLGDQMYTYMGADSKDALGVIAFQRGRVTVEMLIDAKKTFTTQMGKGVVYLDQVGQWLDGQARQQG